jgi:hypothetical protein
MYIARVMDKIDSKVRAVLVNRKQSPEGDLACDAALDTVMAAIGQPRLPLRARCRMARGRLNDVTITAMGIP